MRGKIRNKRHGISSRDGLTKPLRERAVAGLEAAVFIALFMAVLLQGVLMLYCGYEELRLFRAAERSAREVALLDAARSGVTGIGEKSDVAGADMGSLAALVSSSGISASRMAPYLNAHGFLAGGAERIAIRNRVEEWYKRFEPPPLRVRLLREPGVALTLPEEQDGNLVLRYRLAGLWQVIDRRMEVPVINWRGIAVRSGNTAGAADSERPSSADELWGMEQKKRGQSFRERYGANLDTFHPTIAKAEGGEGTMIHSVDLCRPYYTDPAHIKDEVGRQITTLQNYDGVSDGIPLRSKRFLLIVPENSPREGLAVLEEMARKAKAAGLTWELKADGCSPFGTTDEQTGQSGQNG